MKLLLTPLLLLIFACPLLGQDTLSDVDIYPYRGTVQPERGVNPGIAGGPHSGLYLRFAEDISEMCYHGDPRIRLNVFSTKGSFDSIKRLRTEDEVQIAIVQSDIWYYALKHSSPEHMAEMHPTQADSEVMDVWENIENDISLITPLYTEAIHVLIREDAKTEYKDFMDLISGGATVNVGAPGSGAAITCTLLEEILLHHSAKEVTWNKRNFRTEYALELLSRPKSKNEGDDKLDAVILVGGVPFPPLEKFGLRRIKEEVTKDRLFGLTESTEVVEKEVGELRMVPFGEEATRIIRGNAENFGGYFPTEIEPNSYSFLTKNAEPIQTLGITACLVTHSDYNEDAGEESHKINWVRHIVKRMLMTLSTDPNSEYGLDPNFGVPRAGKMWKEVSENLSVIHPDHDVWVNNPGEQPQVHWNDFGWQRHPDNKLITMVDIWMERYGLRDDKAPRIFDPRTKG